MFFNRSYVIEVANAPLLHNRSVLKRLFGEISLQLLAMTVESLRQRAVPRLG